MGEKSYSQSQGEPNSWLINELNGLIKRPGGFIKSCLRERLYGSQRLSPNEFLSRYYVFGPDNDKYFLDPKTKSSNTGETVCVIQQMTTKKECYFYFKGTLLLTTDIKNLPPDGLDFARFLMQSLSNTNNIEITTRAGEGYCGIFGDIVEGGYMFGRLLVPAGFRYNPSEVDNNRIIQVGNDGIKLLPTKRLHCVNQKLSGLLETDEMGNPQNTT